MKNYRITVNGVVYEVSVEELGETSEGANLTAAAQAPAPAKKAPVKKSTGAGSVKVNAPMPGKIVGTKVSVGDAVTKGDVLVVLEAMKMENEINAPQDGVVASVDVAAGDSVESGDVLVTLK